MKTNLSLIPPPILQAAVTAFVSGCERFPGLRVTQDKERTVTVIEVPMWEVCDTTSDARVDVVEIPVFAEYENIEFDFSRIVPSVNGVVRVDIMNGKSWLVADFSDLGKQRYEYDNERKP